jgi:amidophosphoribosyltransferase
MCGIFGSIGEGDVLRDLFDGIDLLQHRGQEGTGVLVIDPPRGAHDMETTSGGIQDLYGGRAGSFRGTMGVTHVRYKTTGSAELKNVQPFWTDEINAGIVHNGQLINMDQIRFHLEGRAKILKTDSDGELILRIFAHFYDRGEPDPVARVFNAVRSTQRSALGGYAVIMPLQGTGLLAFRDPRGIRPLSMGEGSNRDGRVVSFASESIALSLNGYGRIHDLAHGEAVLVTPDLSVERRILEQECRRNCGFEFFYFADASSAMEGRDVNDVRFRMGKLLADRTPRIRTDFVVPVPETSRAAASGYSERAGIPYKDLIYKYRYHKRVFITPNQESRERIARRAFRYVKKAFEGARVMLIDDSIVRGTNMREIVGKIRSFGAREVHIGITWPRITAPCPYGIDMPEHLLVAQNRSPAALREYLGADSIAMADEEDVSRILKSREICMQCVNGIRLMPDRSPHLASPGASQDAG